MAFLHPALLYLAPLAAIPILLHLLMLHRANTMELSTFRFLFDTYVQQRRRMRFREALLAALRTLFILVLVLAAARPVPRHWNALFSTGSGRDIVMLMDCSASMSTLDGGMSALDRAKNVAHSILERLNPEDRLTLVRVTSRPLEICSQYCSDLPAFRAHVDNLELSPGRGNVYAALNYVFGSGTPARNSSLVYLFTDCQKSGWDEARAQGLERLVPPASQIVVVNVGSREKMTNVAIIGDAPEGTQTVVGLPMTLQTRVVNFSAVESVQVAVGIMIDDKEIARANFTLKPGEKVTRKIIYTPTEPGNHRGRFEITGKAADPFPEDDRFLFTLAVAPRLKVTLVNGFAGQDPFDNESLYLKAALGGRARSQLEDTPPASKNLTAMGPGQPEAPLLDNNRVAEIARSLEVTEVRENALTAEAIKGSHVIILANCGGLHLSQYNLLREFAVAGGGLLVFPGDRVNPESYNSYFFPFPSPSLERLTPVTLGPATGDPEKADSLARLTSVDLGHPVFSVFDDPDATYWKTTRVYRRFSLNRPDKKDSALILAAFSPNAPALVESRVGAGTMILAAFPASPKWTNLPLKPEFVPLLLRLVSYLRGRPEVESNAAVAAEETAIVHAASSWAPVLGHITNPRGKTTPLSFERSGSGLAAAYEQTSTKGYYVGEVTGGGHADTPNPHNGHIQFAVNVTPEESDLSQLTEIQIKELFPPDQCQWVDASGDALQVNGSLDSEQEFWRILIWVMLAIIALEFMLASMGGRGLDQATSESRARRSFLSFFWFRSLTGGPEIDV